MIKKIIFFLVFSVVSLAQQIELKSIEKTIITNGQNYTTTLSQSYDEKNKKLEVLYVEKGDYPFGTKEIIQFDAEGNKELSKEKFKYNISTGNWNKLGFLYYQYNILISDLLSNYFLFCSQLFLLISPLDYKYK